MNTPQDPAARFIGPGAWRHGLSYGLLGLPLAFVALPLYVILPNHYASEFGVPLLDLDAMETDLVALLQARTVNEVLKAWHLFGDHCTLRRELVEMKMLERSDGGEQSWVLVRAAFVD